eukprot:jgi/Mesen1/3873/ME000207S02882
MSAVVGKALNRLPVGLSQRCIQQTQEPRDEVKFSVYSFRTYNIRVACTQTAPCRTAKTRLAFSSSDHLGTGGGFLWSQTKCCSRAVHQKTGWPVRSVAALATAPSEVEERAPEDTLYDAIVIGAGMGGVVAATQLAIRKANVLLLEKYIIPGGSSGYFERDGYMFDVGSSVMFGFGDNGNVNLITRALAAVGKKMDLIPDPTTVQYHMPGGLSVTVFRAYEEFVAELTARFPHEAEGIRGFYGECWRVLCDRHYGGINYPRGGVGKIARELVEGLKEHGGRIQYKANVRSIILEHSRACFIVSTVDALHTPMINAAMVLCDRHYGGINYPRGGVGKIARELVEGLKEHGGRIQYKANVRSIILEHSRAVGVRLSDGREYRAKSIISNATRWDTFEKLVEREAVPEEERAFQRLYKKSPSFLSIHLGVDAAVVPPGTDCHHLVLETEWGKMEEPYGTIFLSMPTMLDASLAPPGRHILHIFTTAWMHDWEGLSPAEYVAKKTAVADVIVERLERVLFPGLKAAVDFCEVGTPRTHRRFLARDDGTYGPIPAKKPRGLLGMPFNTTAIEGLYCVGDSCFPGQGVIAVAFSGIMCGHRVAADLGIEQKMPILDKGLNRLLAFFRSLA